MRSDQFLFDPKQIRWRWRDGADDDLLLLDRISASTDELDLKWDLIICGLEDAE